jgi:hypothetical protein
VEKWLIVSNCQAIGLCNSLSLLNPSKHCSFRGASEFLANSDEIVATFDQYERVFIGDGVIDLRNEFPANKNNIIIIPMLDFYAFHPDLSYVFSDGNIVKSPMDDYHSTICLAAFQGGLSEENTLRLYRREIYEKAGYFGLWPIETEQLIARFQSYGYEIRTALRRWSLHDAFMYSVNHPKIQCLFDLARMATLKAGFTPVESNLLPHDNLANGGVFPIYPEIAEEFGVSGCYRYKPQGDYSTIGLEQFIRGSFSEYRKFNPQNLTTFGSFDQRRRNILAAIRPWE